MEDYDTFVQIHLSHLRKREEEKEKPLPSSSLIRFYGKPVLPPLLSEEQREEMQRHREAAQKAAVHRKVKDDPRMTHVQTILHSVQLRTTPTLEELLQESEIYTTSSYSHQTNDGSGSPSSHFQGTKDDVSLSSPPNRKENIDVALPPFTSTAYSAFLATNMTPRQEGCHMDPCYSQNGSQPSSFNGVSHLSSGYVTYENVENATGVTVGIDSGRESNGFVTSKGADSMNGYFLHNTSNTIAKMPDIISYPPIDGEELERSGLESSFCKDFEDVKDICGTTLLEDSYVICESSEGEKSESCFENSTEGEANVSVSTLLDLDKDQTLDRVEGQVSVSEHSGFSDNPESSQTSCPHLCPAKEEHLKDDHTEQADIHGDEEESSEEPYRLSLQALLKKSQEYRRRQRMLRNQAKNSKIKERTQEQPKARTEEPSLSDKENDEFPLKGSVTAEGKKTKESRGNIIQSVEMSPKKSWDNDGRIESEEKTVSTTLTGDENIKEMTGVEEETTLRNNKLNISPELMTEFKEISAFARQQPMSTETSPVQEAFSLTTSPSDFHRGGGKYKTIPAPHFCRSPVRCKSSVQDKKAVDETGLRNTGLNKNLSVEEFNFRPQNIHTTVSSKVNVMNEGDLADVSTRSSQHIDQLESNLSGLKVLISDLESTLTENFRNQGLNESKQTQSNDEDSNDAEQNQNELLRRQSLNNSKNSHEDSGSDPSINYMDDGPVIEQGKGTEEVNLSELRLVKTLVTERGKEKCSANDRLTKSYRHHGGSSKQQPTAKCLLSAAQRLRIPDIFRNVASEAAAPSNVSVLSDTSNHPVDRRNEAAEGCQNSTCSPSLNQSYDVDAPSGLWLLEGSGSDFGTIGHLFEEKHLTPESEGEGQSGISKVKRRLLMHMTEDTQDRSADVFRGADSVVRPNSSTPRAAMCWSADHKSVNDRQEQLKQAHAAQVRALQDQHRRQQEELLQALAERFRLLQSVSFPCSMSSSRLGDTLTFTSISQPSSTLSERCRPLLLSAVKGFLTRRLLRTEKVAQLVRTVRDTQQLLQALQQQQSPGRGEFSSRQDLLLQERAALQLRAARYEVNDIFFSLSTGERMQLISWDRELAMERELRRQSGNTGHPRGKSSLSAATQKSLERKKEMMMQKKAAAKNRRALTRTGHTAESSAEQPLEKKRGQFKANPQRVPKSTYSSRPR